MARIVRRASVGFCTTALAASLWSAAVLAEDAPPQTDQSTVQQKVDDVRKAIENDRDRASSAIVPAQQVLDLCKINPKLPQCATH
jgi:hypothetical protein